MTPKLLNAGVYALFLKVQTEQMVRIGRLGNREFASGIYVYVGSGLNSLSGRISRHLRDTKRKHWHIDYLFDGTVAGLVGAAWKTTTKRGECSISRRIEQSAADSVKGFGCSDCDCRSHLHYFPSLRQATSAVAKLGLQYSQRVSIP